ncbi:ABC-2 type transporter [gamma proteobacterium HTCC5015]|nr:ABC-2 type transporter [gamma proteobacterium HTCC5015]
MSEFSNALGFYTLFRKECRRFLRVAVQTVLTPVLTSMLYLAVFAQVLADRVQVYDGIGYVQFLVPGLVMMTVIQNAYANSSSSLIQSKMNGSLNFLLVSPISAGEIFAAYLTASIVRGAMVGAGVLCVALLFVDLPLSHPWAVILGVILSSALLAALGMVAGIWGEQFEQMAVFQNFIIMPLSFLSGVFYSIHSLPDWWRQLSHFNPFFYTVDAFRYGFLGHSDIDPSISFSVMAVSLLLVGGLAWAMLARGYKIRE